MDGGGHEDGRAYLEAFCSSKKFHFYSVTEDAEYLLPYSVMRELQVRTASFLFLRAHILSFISYHHHKQRVNKMSNTGVDARPEKNARGIPRAPFIVRHSVLSYGIKT